MAGRARTSDSWRALKPAFLEAVTAFKKQYNQLPVVVIDSADILAKKDPEFFKDFQNFAKLCADKELVTFVFICAHSSALSYLLGSDNSARSRLMTVEVGDISDKEAE